MKRVLWLAVVFCLGLGTTAFAQQNATTGAIGGRVVDANGAAVVGATVTVVGPQVTRTATTDEEGTFEVKDLLPGLYDVSVEQTGFKKTTTPRVEVFVGKTASLRLELQPGLAAHHDQCERGPRHLRGDQDGRCPAAEPDTARFSIIDGTIRTRSRCSARFRRERSRR